MGGLRSDTIIGLTHWEARPGQTEDTEYDCPADAGCERCASRPSARIRDAYMGVTSAPPPPAYDISLMGESAVLLQAAGPLDLRVQETIWQVAANAGAWPEVREVVPGVNNLLVLFDPAGADPEGIGVKLAQAWHAAGRWPGVPKTVEVPVTYGGEGGPDLLALAAFAGLPPMEVIRLHSAATYVVMAVGAMPGFGYLGGLDPRLAMPRRTSPRLRVEGGAVAIGGSQAAVIPVASPSGWHVLGHTAMRFFDLLAERPSLLEPGDRVRFVALEVLA